MVTVATEGAIVVCTGFATTVPMLEMEIHATAADTVVGSVTTTAVGG